jgi:ABC-type proline/glycine betaine transport system permease subunit
MFEFPEFLNIPLAGWIDSIMDWVLTNWGGFFDIVSRLFGSGIYGVLGDNFEIDTFLWQIPAVWWAFLILVLAILIVFILGVVTWRTMHRVRTTTVILIALTIVSFSILFGLNGIKGILLALP